MATTTTTGELHIVIAALESQGQFVGYTAVTAPLTWDGALARWDELQSNLSRSMHGPAKVLSKPGLWRGHVRDYAVRSVADPRFAPLVGKGYRDAVTRDGFKGDLSGEIKATRAWAKVHGYEGRQGGWIYDPQGSPVVQGWWNFAQIQKRKGNIAEGADDKWYVLNRDVVS
jgi:hypothetical protein